MEPKTMAVRAVRNQLGKRVDAAHYGGEATVVTINGEMRAVIVPYSWWEQRRAEDPALADRIREQHGWPLRHAHTSSGD